MLTQHFETCIYIKHELELTHKNRKCIPFINVETSSLPFSLGKKVGSLFAGESMEKYARAREIYGKLFPCLYYTVQTSSLFRRMELLCKCRKEGESINWLLHYRVITLFDKFYLLVQRTFLMNFNVLNELLWISKAQIISRFSRFSNLIPNA